MKGDPVPSQAATSRSWLSCVSRGHFGESGPSYAWGLRSPTGGWGKTRSVSAVDIRSNMKDVASMRDAVLSPARSMTLPGSWGTRHTPEDASGSKHSTLRGRFMISRNPEPAENRIIPPAAVDVPSPPSPPHSHGQQSCAEAGRVPEVADEDGRPIRKGRVSTWCTTDDDDVPKTYFRPAQSRGSDRTSTTPLIHVQRSYSSIPASADSETSREDLGDLVKRMSLPTQPRQSVALMSPDHRKKFFRLNLEDKERPISRSSRAPSPLPPEQWKEPESLAIRVDAAHAGLATSQGGSVEDSERPSFHSLSSTSLTAKVPDTFARASSRSSCLAFLSRLLPRWSDGRLSVSRKRIAPRVRVILKTITFQVAMFVALLMALFLPDFWVLIDRPTNTDLDVVLTLVLLLFVTEFVMQSVGFTRTYWGSFFFWTDLIGTASMLLDLSYTGLMDLTQSTSGTGVSSNTIIVRAARVAKLGARAGRFTRLMKLLRYLPGMSQRGVEESTAKVISARVLQALSARVSCLIILVLLLVPFVNTWRFPEADWSMSSWLEMIDGVGARYPDRLGEQMQEFERFYEDMNYFPCSLEGRFPNLTYWHWFNRGCPDRSENLVEAELGSVKCNFNFTPQGRLDAAMNMTLTALVMMLMVVFSLVLADSVSGIVLRPLDRLLAQVKRAAAEIFDSVSSMAETMREGDGATERSNSDDMDSIQLGETELLNRVIEKLAVLGQLVTSKTNADDETRAGLGERDRAMLDAWQGTASSGQIATAFPDRSQSRRPSWEVLTTQRAMISQAGLSVDVVDSWNLNPLELDRARCHAACMYFLGVQNHGVPLETVELGNFLKTVEAGYDNVPYHSWFHGVDVTHGVYMLLRLWGAESFFSANQRCALLVSASSHDVGHPGVNNLLLIETAHELAVRYNDKAPLENMHCTRLFEILCVPRNNIFSGLPKQDFQEVRKTCIEAILHTDNSQHFKMVKDLHIFCEVHSEVLDLSREAHARDPSGFPGREATECFRQTDTRNMLLQMMLHVADISNPTKPFRICRIWAQKCLEEFFLQGDQERSLGLQVQALNDRERVNRPQSQIGFIEFLVAPLAFAVLKMLPPFQQPVAQLVENVKKWRDLWLEETDPKPSDDERKSLEDRIRKLENTFIAER